MQEFEQIPFRACGREAETANRPIPLQFSLESEAAPEFPLQTLSIGTY